MDPLTLGASFASGLGGSMGKSSAGPSDAILKGENNFDSSGWNINFGSGGIESSRAQAGALSEYLPYVVIAGVVLIAWRFTRKK
jgi:hypothetical protein